MNIKIISSTNRAQINEFIIPSIPLLGDFNIPLKHEIEFERNL
ncbi:hypothetical protein [Clostridium sp.]|nr:hypothetical protein [Clostridium sp.]MDR3595603.1 hypothetical protein [Clostridium sp.]